MPYFSRNTIAQIATPPGPARLGAIRISGENAIPLVHALQCPGETPINNARGCVETRINLTLVNRMPIGKTGAGEMQCKYPCPARIFIMPGPGSYTRENVVEMHLPGAPLLLQAALDACVRAGARAALPGEFTFRAFRNGRLSLAQAEAVEELVKSGSDTERKRALRRLHAYESASIARWRDKVMDLGAQLEAALDFSEQEVEIDAAAGLAAVAQELEKEGIGTASTSRAAENTLPHIALVGLANAGKSSLCNALVGKESVLVSPTPSTTRDSLPHTVERHGCAFVLSDNPGFHPEGEGSGRAAADRAFSRLGGEDAACWVVDASQPLGEREQAFAAHVGGTLLIALNKTDLPVSTDEQTMTDFLEKAGIAPVAVVRVSARTGEGIEALSRRMAEVAVNTGQAGEWNPRETAELTAALGHCRDAAAELAGAGRLELAADDVRLAAGAFARAMGEGYAEEALTRIFSRFCIGK